MITIPRDALVQLLKSAGSSLTPEQYLASLPTVDVNKKYAARVRASAWSKYILAIVAVISVVFLPFDFDLEALIITIGLCVVTYFEYRVNRYFSEGNPNGPSLGFRNQSLFAVGILIYGLYHALFFSRMQLPEEYRELVDATTMATMEGITRVAYVLVGVVGGVSQFCLAWYYRAAQERT